LSGQDEDSAAFGTRGCRPKSRFLLPSHEALTESTLRIVTASLHRCFHDSQLRPARRRGRGRPPSRWGPRCRTRASSPSRASRRGAAMRCGSTGQWRGGIDVGGTKRRSRSLLRRPVEPETAVKLMQR
jgi:hypothetical protein